MNKLITSLTLSLLGLIVSVPLFGRVVMAGPKDPINLLPASDSPFFTTANNSAVTASKVITTAITFALVVAALLFFFMLVIGGIRWIMSGGEKGNVENARKQITNALIGLAIIFVAWAIIRLVDAVFGVNILSLPIPSIV